jgi:hypothetical protein
MRITSKALLATSVLLLRACIAGVRWKWVYSIVGWQLTAGFLPRRSFAMGPNVTIYIPASDIIVCVVITNIHFIRLLLKQNLQ